MFNRHSDKEWEKLGSNDPYFGVLTDTKYLASNLNESSKVDFFKSGSDYLESVLNKIKNHITDDFKIENAIDFGCGVGRVVIPMAEKATYVTGIDVSSSMIREAKKNCEIRQIHNIEFILSQNDEFNLERKFNFIHSYIVFQHIPVRRGEKILVQLLNSLAEGGVGALHFTIHYYNPIKKLKRNLDKYVPLFWNFTNLIRGKNFFAPNMQMNTYNLDRIFSIFRKHNVNNIFVELDEYDEILNAVFYFQKEKF